VWDGPAPWGPRGQVRLLMANSRLYPLMFEPRFKERVWGGRTLETLYGKALPAAVRIGESWEIADRPDDESVIVNGPLAGGTLRRLMQERGSDVLGDATPAIDGRFPLLCKILDARDKLSLQVHPPADVRHLGDPKTEMWYIAAADPGAELFVGLRSGITRDAFERAVANGTVADCFHRVAVQAGDAMFLPSGRVHAIGAGLVIFEIQQNSDTTFRVDDWNRVGLDGKPRELHVSQSLASIDFSDFEPQLIHAAATRQGAFSVRRLVDHPLFRTDLVDAEAAGEMQPRPSRLRVLATVAGPIAVRGGGVAATLQAGDFCLLPASVGDAAIDAGTGTRFLLAEAG
jgi:mannose-6-phosphate isomerase